MPKMSMRQKRIRRNNMINIVREYPLPIPPNGRMFISYIKDNDGKDTETLAIFREIVEYDNGKPSNKEYIAVSSPIGVVGRIRRADDSNGHGLRLVVEQMNGQSTTLDIERKILAKRYGGELTTRLLNSGVRFYSDDGESQIVSYLQSVTPDKEIVTVSTPGWFSIQRNHAPTFVAPSGQAFDAPEKIVVELMPKGDAGTMTPKGTLDGWRLAIQKMSEIENTPHWTFAVASGFVGPLINLLGEPTAGINFSGLSSGGKTTALKLAASVWSEPTLGNNTVLRTWRTTDNALEATATMCNGTLLALDELGMAPDGKMVGNVIYSLHAGIGKGRMNEFRQLEAAATWRTFVFSSGEVTLQQIIKRDRGKWQPGMAVRFPDVGITDINRSVDRAVIAEFEQGIRANFGIAGPAFVQGLIGEKLHSSPDRLRDEIDHAAKDIAGESANSMQVRAARVFAMVKVAGERAIRYGVLPNECDVAGAVDWAWRSFLASMDSGTLDPEEDAITRLTAWIVQRLDGSIIPIVDGVRLQSIAEGWHDANNIYLQTYKALTAIGDSLTEGQLSRLLLRRGLIGKTEGEGRAKIRYVPGLGNVTVYALSKKALGIEQD